MATDISLNATHPLPLYQQLTEKLRRDIESGVYEKGQKIPTEVELSRQYGVSRITVRNALDELQKSQLLVRKQGKGTFVAAEVIKRDITRNTSFSAICREAGQVPGAKTIKSVIEDGSDEVLRALQLPAGSSVTVLERIRYADGVPVAIEISHFPESYAFLIDEDLNTGSLLQILRQKYNITFQSGRKMIKLVYATHAMSRYLSIQQGYPLILISSLSTDQDGVPAHHSQQYVVGDRFELYV